jgi:phosphoesterase RecJ-like protein
MSSVPEAADVRFPDLEKAGRLLAGADEIVLTCHVGPDGDAMGSMLAVAAAAVAAGKKVFPSFGPPFSYSPSFRFLSVELLVPPDEVPAEPKLMVSFDAGNIER